jgi:hypothetical protein
VRTYLFGRREEAQQHNEGGNPVEIIKTSSYRTQGQTVSVA